MERFRFGGGVAGGVQGISQFSVAFRPLLNAILRAYNTKQPNDAVSTAQVA